MTEKQRQQFNRMRHTLKKIHKYYQTPGQLLRNCEKDYGLGYQESLEMAYENLQSEAESAVKGVKEMKPPKPKAPNRNVLVSSLLTVALLFATMISYGQIPQSFTEMSSYRDIKTVYDTVPSLLQISDTAGYVDYVRGYKGFVVYKNQLVEGPFTNMSFFPEQPTICKYLRNDKQPLPPQYVVWMNKDLRQCILQPIKGL